MIAKRLGAVALGLMLFGSGCLRLTDEPAEAGATGTTCYLEEDCGGEGRHCLSSAIGDDMCGEPGECNLHVQCGKGERCLVDKCQKVTCTGDYDEADDICGTYDCNKDTFVCRTNCEMDAQCSLDNICRAGACVSPKCTSANAAVVCQGFTCDTVLGKCRDSSDYTHACDTVGCAPGYGCVDKHSCEKICNPSNTTDTKQCGDYRCKHMTVLSSSMPLDTCPDYCTEHTDCLNGTVCIEGRCKLQ